MREPKKQMLGTMEPPLIQLSVNNDNKVAFVERLVKSQIALHNLGNTYGKH